jgi:hypothetical protein
MSRCPREANVTKGPIIALSIALALVTLAGCSKPTSGGSETAGAASAATPGADFSARLCTTLRNTAPQLKAMAPASARAQLVLAIADAFQSKLEALSKVSSDIDTISTATCPEVRAPLLRSTGSASLQDAVR